MIVDVLFVLVIVKSATGVSVSVSVAELFAGFGSVVPLGTATLTVLDTVPVAALETVTTNVKVAVPPTARLIAVLFIFTWPLGALQLDPADAVQVHEPMINALGRMSVTVAPVTALGPALVTTIV